MPPNHAEPVTTPQLPSPSARPIVYDSPEEGRDAMPRTEARREPFSRIERLLIGICTLIVTAILGVGAVTAASNARTDRRLQDMQEQIGGMQEQIGALRTEMHQEIGALRTEMHQEIGALRAEMQQEIGALSERIARIETLLGDRLPPREGNPAEP